MCVSFQILKQHKKQSNADKVEQLQNALASLQQASEKQEKKEREIRQRLEKELEMYKVRGVGGGKMFYRVWKKTKNKKI